MTKEEIMQAIEGMTVLELSELVKAMEEKFGVSAAAPVAVAAAAPAAAGGAAEEKTEFDVILTNAGDKKIGVIKVVRELTGLGLKEADQAIFATEKTIKETEGKGFDAERDAAQAALDELKKAQEDNNLDDMKAKLEEAGATVELK